MMRPKLAVELRGLSACVLACAFSTSLLHAAPTAPIPAAKHAPRSETPAPSSAQLQELERTRRELARLAEQVDGLEGRVKNLKDERKKLDSEKSRLERDWKNQLGNAERAHQRYVKSSPTAQSKPEAIKWLETARTEYRAALATAAQLRAQRAALKKLDAEQYGQAALLQKAQTELDGITATFGNAQASLDEWTKRLATQYGAVATAAKLVQTRSGFARVGSLRQAQNASEQRLANVTSAIADSEGRLKRVEQAISARSSAPAAPGKTCDAKSFDWKNLDGENLKLRNGVPTKGDPDFPLSDVYYIDLDGSGSPEALLLMECRNCGPVMSTWGHLHGYALDADCRPKFLGSVEANNFSEPQVKGRKFVFGTADISAHAEDGIGPGQDDYLVESGLVDGKFVTTKVTELK